jgi:hypothetical protein
MLRRWKGEKPSYLHEISAYVPTTLEMQYPSMEEIRKEKRKAEIPYIELHADLIYIKNKTIRIRALIERSKMSNWRKKVTLVQRSNA